MANSVKALNNSFVTLRTGGDVNAVRKGRREAVASYLGVSTRQVGSEYRPFTGWNPVPRKANLRAGCYFVDTSVSFARARFIARSRSLRVLSSVGTLAVASASSARALSASI